MEQGFSNESFTQGLSKFIFPVVDVTSIWDMWTAKDEEEWLSLVASQDEAYCP